MEDLKYQPGWQVAEEDEEEKETLLESREEEQQMYNRVAFEGERILYNFNGAEVAIVPMEDYAVLEAMDREFFDSLEQK